jgi:hypothetical protein
MRTIRHLIILGASFFVVALSVGTPHAQGTPFTIDVWSTPPGADVSIGGTRLGRTPFKWETPLGTYGLRFVLPGFEPQETEVLVSSDTARINITLKEGLDLTRFPDNGRNVVWSSHSNQFRYFTEFRGFWMFNVTSNTKTPSIEPLDVLEDEAIRQKLKLPQKTADATTFSTLESVSYKSPSGRYVAYISAATDSKIAIYDVASDRTIRTDVGASTQGPRRFPAVELVWNVDETLLWVRPNQPNANIFLWINPDTDILTGVTYLWDFRGPDGEFLTAERVTSVQPRQRYAIAVGLGEKSSGRFWLVDLTTKIGQQLPLEGVFDAVFAPDGQSIYAAASEGIFSIDLSLTVPKPKLVSDVVSKRWGVYYVRLAHTLGYAFVGGVGYEAGMYWIYRLPPRQ